MTMPKEAGNSSIEPQQRTSLPQVAWEDLIEPGAYVEAGTGDLYRIPQEALVSGASPIIKKESRGASRLLQVSRNPFCTTLHARMVSAEHNVEPNF